jgi:hypothetical protein
MAYSIDSKRAAYVILGAVCSIVAIALLFGWLTIETHQREFERHNEFLRALLIKAPTEEQVRTAIGVEPYRVASPADAGWLAHKWTNPANSPAEVEDKMKKWPTTVVYLRSPMVYFVYFDAQGVMRDYSCLSN